MLSKRYLMPFNVFVVMADPLVEAGVVVAEATAGVEEEEGGVEAEGDMVEVVVALVVV